MTYAANAADDLDSDAPNEVPACRERLPGFKLEQAELVRAFGLRGREAREMCNMSQTWRLSF